MTTNISPTGPEIGSISELFAVIGQPARIQILLVIRRQAACVCHLEAVLGMRQASISQHLMLLRKVGLVTTQRDGRNIFYRLTNPNIVGLLDQAARLVGINTETLDRLSVRPVPGCTCPQCNPGIDPELACRKPKRDC